MNDRDTEQVLREIEKEEGFDDEQGRRWLSEAVRDEERTLDPVIWGDLDETRDVWNPMTNEMVHGMTEREGVVLMTSIGMAFGMRVDTTTTLQAGRLLEQLLLSLDGDSDPLDMARVVKMDPFAADLTPEEERQFKLRGLGRLLGGTESFNDASDIGTVLSKMWMFCALGELRMISQSTWAMMMETTIEALATEIAAAQESAGSAFTKYVDEDGREMTVAMMAGSPHQSDSDEFPFEDFEVLRKSVTYRATMDEFAKLGYEVTDDVHRNTEILEEYLSETDPSEILEFMQGVTRRGREIMAAEGIDRDGNPVGEDAGEGEDPA